MIENIKYQTISQIYIIDLKFYNEDYRQEQSEYEKLHWN